MAACNFIPCCTYMASNPIHFMGVSNQRNGTVEWNDVATIYLNWMEKSLNLYRHRWHTNHIYLIMLCFLWQSFRFTSNEWTNKLGLIVFASPSRIHWCSKSKCKMQYSYHLRYHMCSCIQKIQHPGMCLKLNHLAFPWDVPLDTQPTHTCCSALSNN